MDKTVRQPTTWTSTVDPPWSRPDAWTRVRASRQEPELLYYLHIYLKTAAMSSQRTCSGNPGEGGPNPDNRTRISKGRRKKNKAHETGDMLIRKQNKRYIYFFSTFYLHILNLLQFAFILIDPFLKKGKKKLAELSPLVSLGCLPAAHSWDASSNLSSALM